MELVPSSLPIFPDLSFPTVVYGETETPWDLRVLLYRGAAALRPKVAAERIAEGLLGEPLKERLDLVARLHSEINAQLVGGGRRSTADTNICQLRAFFSWADRNGQRLTCDTAEVAFLGWTDEIHKRTRSKEIKPSTAYGYAATVAALLDRILERHSPLMWTSRLMHTPPRKSAVGAAAEKQNLEHTFRFGHILRDICEELTYDKVFNAALPIKIPLHAKAEIACWSGMQRSWSSTKLQDYQDEGTLLTRYPIANLRIEAEMFMLIGQTGINLSQALNLKICQYFYVPYLDGYQVKDRKHRKGGEVVFEIYKDFRPHFERYLQWHKQVFPAEERLFPFVRMRGATYANRINGWRLRNICRDLGEKFICPRSLRSTRVNWLLRRSSDPDLTAEMMQSVKATLLDVYRVPSLQRAMSEVVRYWQHREVEFGAPAAAPGVCNGIPMDTDIRPTGATKPDCIRASGCLWCEHHRDVDSQDYVWALVSFLRVKTLEVSTLPGPAEDVPSPPQLAIDRIVAKLRWFQQSNQLRRSWVDEAHARIEEGHWHPAWALILEGA